jgi:prevent-host-death family protein
VKTVGVYEARTRWSEIIREVEQGEVYVITRRGKPVAQLVRDVEPDDDAVEVPSE